MGQIARLFSGDGLTGAEAIEAMFTDTTISRRSVAGETVTPGAAMSLAAYYACIRVISEDVGKLPFVTYRRVGDRGREKDESNPAFRVLLREPNPFMTAFNFEAVLTSWALSWGNGYAEIVRDQRGQVQELWPIHPRRVAPRIMATGGGEFELAYEVKVPREGGGDEIIPFAAEDILHVPALTDNGIIGVSIARNAAETIGLGLANQKQAGAFFGNGMTFGGMIEHPATMSKEAQKRFRESLENKHKGAARAYRLLILEEGMKYNPTAIPPKDAQMIEAMRFTVEEICRWFRVPPHKVQDLSRSTFSNIESQAIEYVGDTLDPWLVRIEQEVNRKLFNGDGRVFAEHNRNALLRGDSAARANFYRTLFPTGAITPEQIAALEGLPPITEDGADKHWVQLNMATLENASQEGVSTNSSGNPAAPPQEPGDNEAMSRVHEFIQAQAPVIENTAQVCARREAKAVSRLAHKHKDDGEKFAAAAGEFYHEHMEWMANTFQPVWQSIDAVAAAERPGELISITGIREAFRAYSLSQLARACASYKAEAIDRGGDKWIQGKDETLAALFVETIRGDLGDTHNG